MELHLTSTQRAIVQHAVNAGRLRGEEDAVREALALWEDRERGRLEVREPVASVHDSVVHDGIGEASARPAMNGISAAKECDRTTLLDADEWSRELKAWSESHAVDAPLLSDEAVERESIYGVSGR